MTSALVGYTGFVGTNLAHAEHFDLLVNSTNLDSLRNQRLERLVCAGLPAAKWIANRHPEKDWDNALLLADVLATLTVQSFILISTIDVYPCRDKLDESNECSGATNHPYGTHRLQFERLVRDRFPSAHIVRLPALFGPGLKKNVLFDLLHDNQLECINADSAFQWYPVQRLHEDLHTVELHRLPLVNLVTEPISTRTILEHFFPHKVTGARPHSAVHYDLRTCFGNYFRGDGKYVMNAHDVIRWLRSYVAERGARS